MRTWGRVSNPDGSRQWVQVNDLNGDPSYVWVTTLIQVLKLSLGESPFYANYGIPAQRAIIQQLMPDFYVAMVQQQFAQYFASLTITKLPAQNPTYKLDIVLLNGSIFRTTIAV